MPPSIALVVPTHNRLEYTKKTIERLLSDPTEEFELYLWDNASTDGTAEYLNDGVNDPRVIETVISPENVGQTGAMNHAWSKTQADLVGKLDNDCLVTPGWMSTLSQAFMDGPRFGALACWPFLLEEFDEIAARRVGKIQQFDGHTILRHPWVCGSGFMMKRTTYERYGSWEAGFNVGTTGYFLRMALAGEINGWYYPLIPQEHMDDLPSEYTHLKTDTDIRKMRDITYSVRENNISSINQLWKRRAFVLRNLNHDSWRAESYVGWRSRLRRLKTRLNLLLGRYF